MNLEAQSYSKGKDLSVGGNSYIDRVTVSILTLVCLLSMWIWTCFTVPSSCCNYFRNSVMYLSRGPSLATLTSLLNTVLSLKHLSGQTPLQQRTRLAHTPRRLRVVEYPLARLVFMSNKCGCNRGLKRQIVCCNNIRWNMEGLAKKKGGVDWQMLRNWMFEKGLNEPCSDLHPNNSCAEEVGLKFIRVARSNNLLYMAIHFVPFLLFKAHNLRKKSKREILAALLKLMKRYVGSILFMSSFVAGFRAMFCVRGTLENTLLKPWFLLGSIVSGFGLFFEESSRRKEIALYAFVRSFPAVYREILGRGNMKIPHVQQLLFVGLFGLLSWCYHIHKSSIHYASIFEKVWGEH